MVSKKPIANKFNQQQLRAWQPLLTVNMVVATYLILGTITIILGAIFIVTAQNIKEIEIDYTDCRPATPADTTCAALIHSNPDAATNLRCRCSVQFTLDSDWNGQVYMYYGMTQFYQNYRRYVSSRSYEQLHGVAGPYSLASCSPLNIENGTDIAPCGLVANSFFNDTITLFRGTIANNMPVELVAEGIAWSTDREKLFQNPSPKDNLTAAFANTLAPPSWRPNFNVTSIPGNGSGQGYENEDLIVWMRTMALPFWRKLYRKIGGTGGLQAGAYTLDIEYNYPVTVFSGTKLVYLSTTSWLGGKNYFLGIAYTFCGIVSVCLGFAYLARQLYSPRKLGDVKLLRWE